MKIFWVRWIQVSAAAIALVGLVLVIAPAFMHETVISLIAPSGEFNPPQLELIYWTYGVMGGVLIGWMGMVIGLAAGPLPRGERWAWVVVVVSIVIWYIPDTFASLRGGVVINAILNTAILILFGIPLAVTYREFYRPAE